MDVVVVMWLSLNFGSPNHTSGMTTVVKFCMQVDHIKFVVLGWQTTLDYLHSRPFVPYNPTPNPNHNL